MLLIASSLLGEFEFSSFHWAPSLQRRRPRGLPMAAGIVRKREPLRYRVRARQRAIWSCRHGLRTELFFSTLPGGPRGLESDHHWSLYLRRPPRRVRSGLVDHGYFWRRQTSLSVHGSVPLAGLADPGCCLALQRKAASLPKKKAMRRPAMRCRRPKAACPVPDRRRR